MLKTNHVSGISGPAAIAALTVALVVGGVTGSAVSTSTQQTSVAPETDTQIVFEQGFAPVVKKAAPAVVNISSSRMVRTQAESPETEELFRRFFGGGGPQSPFPAPQQKRERGLGSGVIVSPDGFVVTNSHLVEGASEVTVALADSREFIGKVVGLDLGTDIAILKINATQRPSLPFGDSSKVQVGDLALAMGNPFGVGRTVTMGIVSATGRGGLGIEDYEDFIQTDASINPGNSGGALTNVRGELIGVNTAILSPSGLNLGIGFAVPSNMVRAVMDQILQTGKVTRGFMGVAIQDVTPEIASAMKLGKTRGALVSDVEPNGPAVRAGIQPGDVIVQINDTPVTESRQLRLILGGMTPGTSITLRVQRDGVAKNIGLTLADTPPKELALVEAEPELAAAEGEPRLGIAITDLTPAIRRHLELPATETGVVISGVHEGSDAEDAGLREGDIIQEVNRKPVQNAAAFRAELVGNKKEPLLLRVKRDGKSLFVAVK
jgi:serine protease Do